MTLKLFSYDILCSVVFLFFDLRLKSVIVLINTHRCCRDPITLARPPYAPLSSHGPPHPKLCRSGPHLWGWPSSRADRSEPGSRMLRRLSPLVRPSGAPAAGSARPQSLLLTIYQNRLYSSSSARASSPSTGPYSGARSGSATGRPARRPGATPAPSSSATATSPTSGTYGTCCRRARRSGRAWRDISGGYRFSCMD